MGELELCFLVGCAPNVAAVVVVNAASVARVKSRKKGETKINSTLYCFCFFVLRSKTDGHDLYNFFLLFFLFCVIFFCCMYCLYC